MNISPGSVWVIWSGDTRLSEQPIHSTSGRWPPTWRLKNWGSCSVISCTHALFDRISC
ncbi:hypothetical protein [Sphingomonas qomolangmaensis]|uniref:Uncharacterized protein n=1 Tax=Sphingomonas qomolangmaensis TaxID=2918765 RepID=A0ABY5LA60_9SPHN|nr:hypothetical protein [Sphingomonas qomolangmaensis]UUL83652.1 hypothetical protein NMP03_05390 [Sphingomonas qomolangmaensis]